jgi:hypothetical protein
MMEAVHTSETSVDNHFTRQYIPEDNSEHNCSLFVPFLTKDLNIIRKPNCHSVYHAIKQKTNICSVLVVNKSKEVRRTHFRSLPKSVFKGTLCETSVLNRRKCAIT